MNTDRKQSAVGTNPEPDVEERARGRKTGGPFPCAETLRFDALFNHPLTDVGLKRFIEDWEKAHAAHA